jgi:hypothetical protein
MKHSDIELPIAFLNGQKYYGCDEEIELAKCFPDHKKILVDELFNNPSKISSLIKHKIKTICFSTTGLYHEKLLSLVEIFNDLDFEPKQIIVCLMTKERISSHLRKYSLQHPNVKLYEFWDIDDIEEFDFKIQ